MNLTLAYSKCTGVSESTLYRRRRELGLLQRARHTDITDADLDNRMTNILRLDPNCGTLMAMGALRSQGISLPQARVYESLRRVAGADRLTARWQTPVERQPYETRCPSKNTVQIHGVSNVVYYLLYIIYLQHSD